MNRLSSRRKRRLAVTLFAVLAATVLLAAGISWAKKANADRLARNRAFTETMENFQVEEEFVPVTDAEENRCQAYERFVKERE